MTSTLPPASGGKPHSVSPASAPLGLASAAAIAAPVVFAASVVGFAALRTDGYTHGTKAVSELGVIGAPNALLFNGLGFVLPGLLIALAAGLFAQARRATGASTQGVVWLGLSGLAFAAAGVFPFDMANPATFTSQAHFAAAMLTGMFWATGIFRVRPALAAAHISTLAVYGRWLALALVINIGWQIAFRAGLPILPGWGQRIGFAGMMTWVMWFGIALRRT